jgi:hypothetical protein
MGPQELESESKQDSTNCSFRQRKKTFALVKNNARRDNTCSWNLAEVSGQQTVRPPGRCLG